MTDKYQQNKPASDDQLDQVFIAFARVFSGTVKKGQKLYVLGPRHDPAKALQKVGPCLRFTKHVIIRKQNKRVVSIVDLVSSITRTAVTFK